MPTIQCAASTGVLAEKTVIREYWEERADDFARLRTEESHSNKYARWQSEILPHLPGDGPQRILDVGTGSGFFAIMLAAGGHLVTAVDLTAAMIERGRETALEAGVSVDFRVMDAEQLDFADGAFDAVISRNLTWTLPNPHRAYREWLRVLRPGGVLLNFDGAYGSEALRGNTETVELPPEHAHHTMPPDLAQRCSRICEMLPISYRERPAWDRQVLLELGCATCDMDPELGGRIYREIDRFYNPTPMFSIIARK